MSEPNSLNYSKKNFLLAWFICSLAAFFYCYEFLLRVLPSVMTTQFMDTYHISLAQTGYLTTSYYAAYTPMQLVAGIILDKIGPRKVMTAAILSCCIGAFILSITKFFWIGILSLFLIGFGSAFAFVGVLKLAANWLPNNKIALLTGVTTTLGMVGAICSQSLIDKLVDLIGWQASWFNLALIGFIVMIVSWIFIRDYPDNLNIQNKDNISWKKLKYDLKSTLGNKHFLLNGLIGGISFINISVFASYWAIPYLQYAGHFKHDIVVNMVPLIFVGMAIGGPVAGWLSEMVSNRKRIIQIGLIISIIIFTIITIKPDLNIYLLSLCLFGLGLFGGPQILVFSMGIDLIDSKLAGTASSATNFLVMLVGTIMMPLISRVLYFTGEKIDVTQAIAHKNMTSISAVDFQIAIMSLPIILGIALVISCFQKNTI